MEWMNKAGSGAAIPGIARKDLLRLPVIVPPQSLMDLFTDLSETSLNQILTLATMNKKLRDARDLLLPRLMSGEIIV
jgi:type I restriction enzyme S subunit